MNSLPTRTPAREAAETRSTLSREEMLQRVRQVLGDPPPDGLHLLHAPTIESGEHWQYISHCLESGWISSGGAFVDRFERDLAEYTGAKAAVAVVNGTAALQTAYLLVGVLPDDEVLMPALTFVATANAAAHCGATPHFLDVERSNLALDANLLARHLEDVAETTSSGVRNRLTGRRISAIVAVHVFGHVADVDALADVANRWNLPLVEDAAEALGSFRDGRHAGTTGRISVLSFNGNKILSTGGGGAILTNDPELGRRAKHLTTTAKCPHPWEYQHDEAGFNHRLPNLNAALGCAQLEQLDGLLQRKRILHERYLSAFEDVAGASLQHEPPGCRSNLWLNALMLDEADLDARNAALEALNGARFQSRPIWTPLHRLPMYSRAPRTDLPVTEEMFERVINLPSSAHLVAAGETP